jgi:hypothetical protein
MARNDEPSRTHVAELVTAPGAGRRARRARRRLEQTTRRPPQPLGGTPAAGDDEDGAEYLPAAGEPGAAALRTRRRFRVPAHQDTSTALAGGYPFLASGGLGAQGVYIGTDLFSGAAFCFDPWVLYARGVLTAPNMVLAGIVGSGKSALAKALATRSIAFGRRVYVPGDPKGEWSAVARQVGGAAIELGHGLAARLNPLDAGPRPSNASDDQWRVQVAARRRDLIGALIETVLGRALTPVEHTAVDVALRAAVSTSEVPVLPLVVDRLLRPDPSEDDRLGEDGRMVGHALRRLVSGDLRGLFDGPSTVRFDPSLPMVTLDLSRGAESDTLLSVLMTCASAWMESALADPDGGQRWVIYYEGWRLMAHPSLLRRMDAQWRLARHFGIANLLVFHKLSDLDNVGDAGTAMRALASSLLANAEVRVIYRQESDQLSSFVTTWKVDPSPNGSLPTLGVGQGLWRIKEHSYATAHILAAAERAVFDTSGRMG